MEEKCQWMGAWETFWAELRLRNKKSPTDLKGSRLVGLLTTYAVVGIG